MRNVLDRVFLFQFQVGAGHGLCYGTGDVLRAVVTAALWVVLQILKEPFIGWLRGNTPLGLDGRQRILRGVGIGRNRGNEIAIAHDLYSA